MLTVGILYPAVGCHICTLLVCIGRFTYGIDIFHTWAFCIVLSLRFEAMRRPGHVRLGKCGIPRFLFHRGVTEQNDMPKLGDSIGLKLKTSL